MSFPRPAPSGSRCSRQPAASKIFLVASSWLVLAAGSFTVAGQAAAQPPATQPPKPAPPKTNPFETVPQSQESARPAPPKPAVPKAGEAPAQPLSFEDVIEAIEFRGVRRVPQDTLRALIFTKRGDKYDEETLHRDFMALWNTGRFDDIKVEREMGRTGWIIRYTMVERRVIRSIKYNGNKSITDSEILTASRNAKLA